MTDLVGWNKCSNLFSSKSDYKLIIIIKFPLVDISPCESSEYSRSPSSTWLNYALPSSLAGLYNWARNSPFMSLSPELCRNGSKGKHAQDNEETYCQKHLLRTLTCFATRKALRFLFHGRNIFLCGKTRKCWGNTCP